MELAKIFGSTPELSPAGFALRTVAVGFILYVMSKFLPRRAGGQFAGYDFVFYWMMGGLAASPLFDSKINFPNTVTAIVTIYFWHYTISYLAVKSPRIARFVFGAPILLMAGGKILRQNMSKALLPTELLLSEMRNVDAPNLADVEYAMMETSGHVSVIKKTDAQPVTPGDLQIPAVEPGLPTVMMDDGKIIQDNLVLLGHDTDWLMKELAKYGVADLNNVYLATVDGTGNLYHSLKKKG